MIVVSVVATAPATSVVTSDGKTVVWVSDNNGGFVGHAGAADGALALGRGAARLDLHVLDVLHLTLLLALNAITNHWGVHPTTIAQIQPWGAGLGKALSCQTSSDIVP